MGDIPTTYIQLSGAGSIRTVCSTKGKKGEDLRNTWVEIYIVDLQWGVRDVRFIANEQGWPRMESNSYMQRKDKNK